MDTYMSMSIIPKKKRGGGRPPGIILYTDVSYEGGEYTVGFISGLTPTAFVIDKEDFSKIEHLQLHRQTDAYVSSSVIVDGKKKELAIHNIVMNKLTFDGKGQAETVDHINRIGFDNRKANLRLATCKEQMLNQRKRRRNIKLPEGCGITHEEIPRHIWYVQPNGLHGERFAIEFITKGFLWRTTSSKSVSLREKLEAAKGKLRECYMLYPDLDPHNPEFLSVQNALTESFHAIVARASSQLNINNPQ